MPSLPRARSAHPICARSHAGPIVAVAGSSGLAPIASIVATAFAAGARQPIHLYHGARREDIHADAFCSEAEKLARSTVTVGVG
jgi:NAD(P)H-flavin reductase